MITCYKSQHTSTDKNNKNNIINCSSGRFLLIYNMKLQFGNSWIIIGLQRLFSICVIYRVIATTN